MCVLSVVLYAAMIVAVSLLAELLGSGSVSLNTFMLEEKSDTCASLSALPLLDTAFERVFSI